MVTQNAVSKPTVPEPEPELGTSRENTSSNGFECYTNSGWEHFSVLLFTSLGGTVQACGGFVTLDCSCYKFYACK